MSVSDVWRMTTPVAFLIFNRPDTTARVMGAIRQAKPPRLLVVADGPRPDRPGEAEKCALTRAVIESVDWDCEVLTDYSPVNLGCKRRVSSGLDWVFSQVEEAIILEDDCLPEPTFFRFCEELLARYRDDARILSISGNNNIEGRGVRIADSYYFSQYVHIWGWATWRRAWAHYDVDMTRWPQVAKDDALKDLVGSADKARFWERIFAQVHAGKIDTWDYQLTFAHWMHGGLSVIPCVNLISNIGFGPEATHTTGESRRANMPVAPMAFPLRHSSDVQRNARADDLTHRVVFDPPLAGRVADKLRRMLTRPAKGGP